MKDGSEGRTVHGSPGYILAAAGAAILIYAIAGRRPDVRDAGRRERAGVAGERAVSRILDAMRIPHVDGLTFLHRGYTVQVDHILDMGDRLVAIETKHFAGTVEAVRGGPWIHRSRNPAIRRFQSPVEQNEWHVRALEERFGTACRGLVVFSGSARITGHTAACVLHAGELRGVLEGMRRNGRKDVSRAFAAIRAMRSAAGHADLASRHVRRTVRRHGAGANGHAVMFGAALAWIGIILAVR